MKIHSNTSPPKPHCHAHSNQNKSKEDQKDYDDKINDASYSTSSVYGFGHPLYYENVLEVLQGKIKPETDGREGLKSLEVLIAAYQSAASGKTISLPLGF